MAESDNVLRGGLTVKNIDAAELKHVLDFDSSPRLLPAQPDAPVTAFPTEAQEFALCRRRVNEAIVLDHGLPRILLTVEGSARLQGRDGSVLDLPRGRAAFVAADEVGIQISGPAVVFEASTGRVGQ